MKSTPSPGRSYTDLPESALHQIWEQRLYKRLTFWSDVERNELADAEVLFPGTLNHDGGPDFSNAKIRLGKLVIAGNIELHKTASDWYKHQHHQDAAYDNTILHVVLNADRNILHRNTLKPLLTCVMEFDEKHIMDSSNSSANSGPEVPASQEAPEVAHKPEKVFDAEALSAHWPAEAEELYKQRLEQKSNVIRQFQEEHNQDYYATIYRLLLHYLGGKVNNLAFEMLTARLPLRIIYKHSNQRIYLEALYLGIAGLLEGPPVDDYMKVLQEQYDFLKLKYGLNTLPAGTIKHMRMRPVASAYRRLAICAGFHNRSSSPESIIATSKNIPELVELFRTPPSDYWCLHYAFGKENDICMGELGDETIQSLLLNVVIPFHFYVDYRGEHKQRALDELLNMARLLPPEKNSIVKNSGIKPRNALESQAILQLDNIRQSSYQLISLNKQ